MELHRLSAGIYNTCDWLVKLAYLNILWIFFTLLGLIVFGFFPATISTYSVTRKWIMGEESIPILNTFWTTYKSQFLKSQIFTLLCILFSFVFTFYYQFFSKYQENITMIGQSIMILFLLLLTSMALYIFPTYVQYEMKFLSYIKNSLLYSVSFFLYTLLMDVGVLIIFILLFLFPKLMIFFSGSILSFWITWVAHKVFKRVDQFRAL